MNLIREDKQLASYVKGFSRKTLKWMVEDFIATKGPKILICLQGETIQEMIKNWIIFDWWAVIDSDEEEEP